MNRTDEFIARSVDLLQLCSHGLYSCRLYSYGLYTYDVYGYGVYGHGLERRPSAVM